MIFQFQFKVQQMKATESVLLVRLPQAREVPDFDDTIVTDRQDPLSIFVHVDADDRVLCIQEGR